MHSHLPQGAKSGFAGRWRDARPDHYVPGVESYTLQAVEAGLAVYQALQREINALEQSAQQAVGLSNDFKILHTELW